MLLRDPFAQEDFEKFIQERQRSLSSAMERLKGQTELSAQGPGNSRPRETVATLIMMPYRLSERMTCPIVKTRSADT